MCIVGGIGTGNLLRINERRFIVTCKHVADIFFSNKQYVITLKSNKKIKQDNLIYLKHSKSQYDTALIEIMDRNVGGTFYELSDIEVIEDFSKYSFTESNIHLCGFPDSIKIEDSTSIRRKWFSYLTIPIESKNEEDFLYCDYTMNSYVQNFKSNYNIKLPLAPGLSGSFVHLVNTSKISVNKIWSLKSIKVIAMQIEWNEKSYLKCVNIKHLQKLLNSTPI